MLRSFFAKEEGQGLVEYALVLVLIAIVVIGIISLLGGKGVTCREGYFYDYGRNACVPGYRP